MGYYADCDPCAHCGRFGPCDCNMADQLGRTSDHQDPKLEDEPSSLEKAPIPNRKSLLKRILDWALGNG